MEKKRNKYVGHEERGRRSKNNRRINEIGEIIGKREYKE
jgi:hypothetical protein